MALSRKYRKEFENEFTWVRKDPDGNEMAYCELCEISITPTSSCLSTHEASARHQKNAYDIKTTGQKAPVKPRMEGPKPSQWKKDYDKTRRFREEWLGKFPWIRRDPDGDRFGFCPYCNIKLEPKTKRIEDHERTYKHRTNIAAAKGGAGSSLVAASSVRKRILKRGRKRKHVRRGPFIHTGPQSKKAAAAAEEEEDEEEAETEDNENAENEFDKIHDISELMEELPTLLEGENENSSGGGERKDKVGVDGDDDLDEGNVGVVVETHVTKSEFIDHTEDGQSQLQQQTEDEGIDFEAPSTSTQLTSSSIITGSIPNAPVNRFTAEFPWVILASDENSFPYCPFCGVFVEPYSEQLQKHQESKKHIRLQRIGFHADRKPLISSSSETGADSSPRRKRTSSAAKGAPDQFVPNPPTKRRLALETKKKLMEQKMQSDYEYDDDDDDEDGPHDDEDEQEMSGDDETGNREIKIDVVIPEGDGQIVTTVVETEGGMPSGQPVSVEYVKLLMPQGDDLGGDEVLIKYLPDESKHDEVTGMSTTVVEMSRSDDTPKRKYIRRDPNEPKGSSWRKEYEKSRRFQPEWLRDHPWVKYEKRKNGIETTFCPYCNIDLEARVVRLRQHENTRKHKKNEELYAKRVADEEAEAFQKEEPEERRKSKAASAKTEVRPRYKCDLCNLRFVAQRNLYLHLKDHYEPNSKDSAATLQQAVQEEIPEVSPAKPEVKHEYNKAWERIFPWLQKAVDDEWAFCSLCKFPMEPKLSIIKAHLRHRRHVKLVALQDDPTKFIPKPDVTGILAADEEKKEIRKRNNVAQNADVVRDEDGKEKYQCKVCKKVLVKTSFAVHMRIHQGLRPFQCTMCEWAFKQAYDLKHHVESIHNGIKAHQCDLCGKEFTRKYTLRLHLKSHTDVRDYQCQTCHRGFFTRGKLVEHERTHTGEKPFLCDFCGRGFRIKYDMVQHRLKTHFGLPAKRRKPNGPKMAPTTTTYITTKDGIIDEQAAIMTVEDSVEVEMDDHTVHTVHTIDGAVIHEPKHQLVFISENEAVFLTK